MTIIFYTACSRPQNLDAVLKSIQQCDGNAINWHHVVCFDSERNFLAGFAVNSIARRILETDTPNTTFLAFKNPESRSGNAQRNACINFIMDCDGIEDDAWLYCIDDDNVLHQDFWETMLEAKDEDDIVTFGQVYSNNKVRLNATLTPQVGTVDSATFAVRKRIVGETRWELNRYEADGIFAHELSKKTNNVRAINRNASYYNYLRPNGNNS